MHHLNGPLGEDVVNNYYFAVGISVWEWRQKRNNKVEIRCEWCENEDECMKAAKKQRGKINKNKYNYYSSTLRSPPLDILPKM